MGNDPGVEIEFLDGKRVVRRDVAPLIQEATKGEPARFLFKEAMRLMGGVAEKQLIRQAQQSVIRAHFAR